MWPGHKRSLHLESNFGFESLSEQMTIEIVLLLDPQAPSGMATNIIISTRTHSVLVLTAVFLQSTGVTHSIVEKYGCTGSDGMACTDLL